MEVPVSGLRKQMSLRQEESEGVWPDCVLALHPRPPLPRLTSSPDSSPLNLDPLFLLLWVLAGPGNLDCVCIYFRTDAPGRTVPSPPGVGSPFHESCRRHLGGNSPTEPTPASARPCYQLAP